MKTCMQGRSGMPRGMSQYPAWLGCKNKGFETVLFEIIDELGACE